MDPILLVLLLFAVLRLVDGDAGSASTVRSWDCCKPSCSWKGAADVSAPVAACDGTNQILKNFDEDSSCGGGKAYLCANQQPWQIDARTSYGFAAVQLQGQDRSAWCCACYHLTFTSGHAQNQSMVVQAISMSPGNPDNIFNLFIPGGGLSEVSSCSAQYQQSSTVWGSTPEGLAAGQDCENLPQELRDGCLWRFGWFADTLNPTVNFQRVRCPEALTAKSGCVRKDEPFLSFASPFNTTAPLPASSSKSPNLNTGSIAGISVAGALFLTSFGFAIYHIRRRQGKANDIRRLIDKKVLSRVCSFGGVRRTDSLYAFHRDQGIQELYPNHLGEVDNTQIHQLDAMYSLELSNTTSRKTTLNGKKTPSAENLKPLSRPPVELSGDTVTSNFERSQEEWELDYIRCY